MVTGHDECCVLTRTEPLSRWADKYKIKLMLAQAGHMCLMLPVWCHLYDAICAVIPVCRTRALDDDFCVSSSACLSGSTSDTHGRLHISYIDTWPNIHTHTHTVWVLGTFKWGTSETMRGHLSPVMGKVLQMWQWMLWWTFSLTDRRYSVGNHINRGGSLCSHDNTCCSLVLEVNTCKHS